MKRLILATVLISLSLASKLYAQTSDDNTPSWTKLMNRSKTEATFDLWEGLIQIRDYVVLKEGRMILDLGDETDYEGFRNLDSILIGFRKDIAFYKDSISADPTASVRIDYVLNSEYAFKKIRFTSHKAKGSSFLDRDGEISKLKFEQDTVRIIMHKTKPGVHTAKNGGCNVAYTVQATFLLGNYTDIDKIIADHVLTHIIDTLEKASHVKRRHSYDYKPVTIVYNPYFNGHSALTRHNFLMANEFATNTTYGKYRISFNPQFGAGIVRNTLAPIADIAFQYNRYWNDYKERNIFRISGTGYYFFGQDSKGGAVVNDNWFINGTVGNVSQHNDPGWYGQEETFGVGYLVSQKGNYFKRNTFRVFTDIMFVRGVSLVPEIIFTDNFKQVFPGISVKVFQ